MNFLANPIPSYSDNPVFSIAGNHLFVYLCVCVLVAQPCLTLCDLTDYSARLLCPWDHGILQQEYWSGLPFPSPEIFSTQKSIPSLLHYRQILYCLSYREILVLTRCLT